MGSQTFGQQDSPSADENVVRALYQEMPDDWNKRRTNDFAAPFAGVAISSDSKGSQMVGRHKLPRRFGRFCRPS